jgi:hypothetical protein
VLIRQLLPFFLVMSLLWMPVGAAPLRLQAGDLPVSSNEALVDFPHTVTFRLSLSEPIEIRAAQLSYQLGRDGCLQAGTRVPVEPVGDSLEWTWVMSRSGNPPPGAQMRWRWTVVDAQGREYITPMLSLTFSDERFAWQTISYEEEGVPRIALHWYEGAEVGPLLLDAAVSGLDRLENDTGIRLQGTAQFFIYGSAADMRDALLYVQDWAGGVAFSDYNTILIGSPPDLADSWGRDTVRHELAHLLVDQFARSCLGGSRPTWLEEGLAVFAEGEADEQTRADIARAVEQDTLLPVRSLNGPFPARGSEATLAYSQSHSLVTFLLDAYGAQKIRELLLLLAEATDYDAALEQVYGFNADGLELAWRAAIGAPPRDIPPTPTPIVAAAIPTIAPLGAAQAVPTPEGLADVAPGTNQSPSPVGSLCGLALVAPLLAVGAHYRRRGPRAGR